MIDKDKIKVGDTYLCDDGKYRVVEGIEGQRLLWRRADEPAGVTMSGEWSLGRFAARCETIQR